MRCLPYRHTSEMSFSYSSCCCSAKHVILCCKQQNWGAERVTVSWSCGCTWQSKDCTRVLTLSLPRHPVTAPGCLLLPLWLLPNLALLGMSPGASTINQQLTHPFPKCLTFSVSKLFQRRICFHLLWNFGKWYSSMVGRIIPFPQNMPMSQSPKP